MLCDIIESNHYALNRPFYGHLQFCARKLLGYSKTPMDKRMALPSALEHLETSLRDPAFWMFFKRMVAYMQKYKMRLPAYTYDELAFPGVKIDEVEIDKLITYIDIVDTDITNAVYMTPEEMETDPIHVSAIG